MKLICLFFVLISFPRLGLAQSGGGRQDFAFNPCRYGNEFLDKHDIVREVVERYQDLAVERYQQKVVVRFFEEPHHCDVIQMTAALDRRNGQPRMEVYHGILEAMETDAIIAATCHELGHFFGDVSLEEAGQQESDVNLALSVEGEADYFAGKCVTQFLPGRHAATEAGRNLFATLHGDRAIDHRQAMSEVYSLQRGIDASYPTPQCRMLSYLAGVLDEPRPKCWYNPQSVTDANSE